MLFGNTSTGDRVTLASDRHQKITIETVIDCSEKTITIHPPHIGEDIEFFRYLGDMKHPMEHYENFGYPSILPYHPEHKIVAQMQDIITTPKQSPLRDMIPAVDWNHPLYDDRLYGDFRGALRLLREAKWEI